MVSGFRTGTVVVAPATFATLPANPAKTELRLSENVAPAQIASMLGAVLPCWLSRLNRLILNGSQGVGLRLKHFAPFLLACSVACLCTFQVRAQSLPTASRGVIPSVFGGVTGAYTGLNGGRNLGLTAGFDLGFKPFFGLLPSAEVRGTYPVDNGSIVGEEHVEGGIRLQKRYGRVRPYVDFLFGRGELNYQHGGYPVPAQAFRYLQTTSNVISPGIGFEVDMTPRLALLLDGQGQIWHVPFDPSGSSADSGHIISYPGTIGVVYRFNWLDHGHPAP